VVLAADVEGDGANGANLVGLLRYKSSEKPTLQVFEERHWLQTAHEWSGTTDEVLCSHARGTRRSLTYSNRLADSLREDDPKTSWLGAWEGLAGWFPVVLARAVGAGAPNGQPEPDGPTRDARR
jgi:hypothetical protein